MDYYRSILLEEPSPKKSTLVNQDTIVMLFPLLVKGDYIEKFKQLLVEMLESATDEEQLQRLSSIVVLGIKYHLLDGKFVRESIISTVYTDDIKNMLQDACTVVSGNTLRNNRLSVINGTERYDSHKSINPTNLAHYLVYRLYLYLKSIKHTEFLVAILDEGRNPSLYPNFAAMSAYTNDISRFVSNSRDSQYFITVIKILVELKNYHIIGAIITALQDVPKKYEQYIKDLTRVVMAPTYGAFVDRLGGRSKSTGSIPFIGTLITDIKHAIETMNTGGSPRETGTVTEGQWKILYYIRDVVKIFAGINRVCNYMLDFTIDQYFNRVIEDLYIYSRKMYEWTVSDTCSFIRNALITNIVLYDIEAIVQHVEQRQIEGKLLEKMTIDELMSLGMNSKTAKRIYNRVAEYDRKKCSYYDSVHDTCILLRNSGLVQYCKQFAEHEILPAMLPLLTDEDMQTLSVQPVHFDKIRLLKKKSKK